MVHLKSNDLMLKHSVTLMLYLSVREEQQNMIMYPYSIMHLFSIYYF